MHKWVQDSKGRWHRFIRQSATHSCGMACCAMVASGNKQRYVTEATFIGGPQGVQGYAPGVGTRAIENMAQLLEDQQVPNMWQNGGNPGYVAQILQHVDSRHLAIFQVTHALGNHYVVGSCVYPTDGTVVLVDPDLGLQEQKATDFPNYLGGLAQFTGEFLLAT